MFGANPKSQHGLIMIEVLVAFVVLAMGLLGMLGLQTKAQQTAMETYQRSQALIVLDDMLNRMYANAVEAKSCYLTEDFNELPGQWTDNDAEYLGCSDASDRDLVEWNAMLRGSGELIAEDGSNRSVGAMIGAVGCVLQDATDSTLVHVSVAWQGLYDLPTPADTCGQGLYDDEARRRVVSVPVRLTDWK